MTTKLSLATAAVLMTAVSARANDPNEVVRTSQDTYKLLKPAKDQATKLRKIDDKYGALLAKLRKAQPKDYGIQRDNLNQKYTHEFMTAMDPVQKSDYRKYIRGLRQKYMKAHPEVDADNIFIWGCADII